MQVVIFVPEPGTWRSPAPGGLALLERQLKQVRAMGWCSVHLLIPDDHPDPELADGGERCAILRVGTGERDAFAALATAGASLPNEFVLLTADYLVDTRVLRTLAQGPAPVLACASDGRTQPIGHLTAALVRRHGAGLAAACRALALQTIDPYLPELRGTAAPYVLPVRSAAHRRVAWRTLLDHVQKRTLDLPGQYFDTPFENALVRRLAPTSITPNQVTAATIVLAAIVGVLLFYGWLRLAIVLALAVGILDGVDGKLARLKLATSKLGSLEHIADFFYENTWYLALAAYLRTVTGMDGLWHAGVALVACDLTDNLLYLAVKARTGTMLDELSAFDRGFRRVAGRRNVYVMILVPGIFGGHAATAFIAAAAWAGVTALVHAVRTIRWFAATPPRRVLAAQPSWLTHAVDDVEPVGGAAFIER